MTSLPLLSRKIPASSSSAIWSCYLQVARWHTPRLIINISISVHMAVLLDELSAATWVRRGRLLPWAWRNQVWGDGRPGVGRGRGRLVLFCIAMVILVDERHSWGERALSGLHGVCVNDLLQPPPYSVPGGVCHPPHTHNEWLVSRHQHWWLDLTRLRIKCTHTHTDTHTHTRAHSSPPPYRHAHPHTHTHTHTHTLIHPFMHTHLLFTHQCASD